jgi:hypothetical protein
VAVTFRARSYAESDQRLQLLIPGGGEDRILKVNSFEIRGPFKTSGVSETQSRDRIFSCYPQKPAEELPCARSIGAELARRAFRRPLFDGELDNLLQAYMAARTGKSFDEGVRGLVTRILASPDFLYRAEPPPADKSKPGDVYTLTDLQLASRLSFFLWSSLPDDELLKVAAEGSLHEDKVLEQQVLRMLADQRAKALANDFAFQWLGLSKLADIEPDQLIFPYAANQRDLEGGNASVLDLMNADYTYLNERLAVHYGIRDVKGSNFRRVQLTDPNRFGLLGKAAVLMVSSYPNRTSPVLRGAWILDNITGTPPTPPPPNVEALKDALPGAKVLTMKEQMAVHRKNKSCFACHGVLDPLGFALENFDGVGQWRVKDRIAESPIDASGELPDGTPIAGPVDLRNALMKTPDQFVQTLVTKLMIYGVGRPIEWQDMPTVRAIVKDSAGDNYRFATLITAIVKSAPFRMQQIPSEPLPDTRQAAALQ